MKILFTTSSVYTLNDLLRWADSEGIGFATDWGTDSRASLTVWDSEEKKLYIYAGTTREEAVDLAECDPGNPGRLYCSDKPWIGINNGVHELSDLIPSEGDQYTWVTAWSGFRYIHRGTTNDRDTWEYHGAQRGFLAQNLIPPFQNVRIERTEGSCGTFEGPDALARYSEVARKTKWREENETAEAIKPLVFDKGFSAPCGTPDDLAKALGISEAFAAKLNGAGVFHVWQIRQFTMDDMHALDIKLSAKGRVLNSGWNSGSLPED